VTHALCILVAAHYGGVEKVQGCDEKMYCINNTKYYFRMDVPG
jgi:hypothetical protein